MREIKFRAWNTKTKEMFSAEEMAEDQLTLLPTGKFINVHSGSLELSVIYPIDIMIPMQYIGLKDKNSKEIFEGDILCFLNDMKYGLKEVIYSIDKGGWNFLVDSNEDWDTFDSNDYEVIGNIYENPELLKGGDKS